MAAVHHVPDSVVIPKGLAMKKNRAAGAAAGVALVGLVASAGTAPRIEAARVVLAPATMKRIATVDERFQSYNVEMAEVVGGRFWKPYTASGAVPVRSTPPAAPGTQPGAAPQVGLDPNLFQARPPIDLSNVRLRTLAAALGPAYHARERHLGELDVLSTIPTIPPPPPRRLDSRVC